MRAKKTKPVEKPVIQKDETSIIADESIVGKITADSTIMTQPHGIQTHREQTPATVEEVNKNKILEEVVLRRLDAMSFALDDADMRFIAIARTYLQLGFMALNRAAMKPERINGEIDLHKSLVE